jgi:3-oxoacyl-[acyl-carrier-protein] synthase-3
MSLEAFGYFLPNHRQSAEDIATATNSNVDFLRNKVGIREKYILGPNETGVSLATQACEALFSRSQQVSSTVDLIVCVTQNPDQRIPHNSALIARNLGLPTTIAAFDVSLGCSGYVYALSVVKGFLSATGRRTAVLVTCDPYSRIMTAEDKDTNSLFGDAATATLIKADGTRSRTLATDFGTDGFGANAIEVRAGGASKPHVSLNHNGVQTYDLSDLRLRMNGRAVFNFVMDRVPKSINTCLQKANLSASEIDYFLLHQGSEYMLDALVKHSGIPANRVPKNISQFGNTVSSSVPLLAAELDASGELNRKTVLLSGFGVGLSWATTIISFN